MPVPSVITTKSVSAGEYEPPPAAVPDTTEICGTRPESATFARKMRPYPASAATPSWTRAPPESTKPTTGARARSASSITRTIVSACASPSDPPETLESCA
jgi:hypothetical protein